MFDKNNLNHDFFKIWSSDMAYILGFITGDGYVNQSQNVLEIKLHKKDIEILEFIKNKIYPDKKIELVAYYDKSNKRRVEQIRLRVYSKILIDSLVEFGVIQAKTGKEKWPKSIPQEFVSDYVRGYFDADGCVYKRNRDKGITVCVCCANGEFLKEIQTQLMGIGNIIKRKIYDLRITNMHDVLSFKNFVYNGNFCLKRKWDLIKEYNLNTFDKKMTSKAQRKMFCDIYLQEGFESVKEKCKELNFNFYTILAYLAKQKFYKKQVNGWTDEELKIIKHHSLNPNRKEAINEVSKIINRSKYSIKDKLTKFNKLKEFKKWTKEEVEILRNNSIKETSILIGRSNLSIRNKRNKLGINKRTQACHQS